MSSEFQWHSELLSAKDVVGDPSTCAWGIFAPCVLFGRNVNRITDGQTSFKKAALSHLAMGGCCCWCCCLPYYAARFREQLRRKRNLPEDPFDDIRVHQFFHPCAICQEEREMKYVESKTAMPRGPQSSTVDRTVDDTVKHLEEVRSDQRMERS